jgi:hypothetical protein
MVSINYSNVIEMIVAIFERITIPYVLVSLKDPNV